MSDLKARLRRASSARSGDPILLKAADCIAALEDALVKVRDGEVPRPIGKAWRADGKPSKNDKCTHDVWMYEDCGACIADFVDAVLKGDA